MMNKIKCIFFSCLMILMASSPLFLTNEPGNLLDNASKFNSDETNSDLDGDGFTNAVEEECGSDPADSASIPDDLDSDGTCDILDDDIDGDSWSNDDELTCGSDPTKASSIPEDGDGDGFCDVMDAFPDDELEWVDSDNDGTGDNRDTDDDNDGVNDDLDVFPDYPCAAIDTDNDGFPDSLISWNCKTILQPDWDDDNDGVFDSNDAYPLDACFAFDTDNDGLPNDVLPGGECDPSIGIDLDDDNDGWADIADAFPLNPREWADQDFDGIGNNEDINDDNDGWSDLFEELCETDPLSPASVPVDTDGDGLCDVLDPDDDNDGVFDDQDSEPLSAAGSWEWATGTGDMIQINDMAMDSNGDIIVTGSFRGDTTLGDHPLVKHNKEDAFVAKMDDEGNWLWASQTVSHPKLCANGKGIEITLSGDTSYDTIYDFTGMKGYVNPPVIGSSLPWQATDENYLDTHSMAPLLNNDATQFFSVGDYVYDNGTQPPSYIGEISSVTTDRIVFTSNLLHYGYEYNLAGNPGSMELVILNQTFQASWSVSGEINSGGGQKKLWDDSLARAHSIAIDGDDSVYITGVFDGFIKFQKSGFNDVIESYNVRNEGNWLKKEYRHGQGTKFNFNSYPCGAPSDYFQTGTDMFVAKIDTNGDWKWAKGAGSPASDSGDIITMSGDGTHAYIAGKLQQNWCGNSVWVVCSIPAGDWDRNDGCIMSNHEGIPRMNGNAVVKVPVKSHSGMFNNIAGVDELKGCGAFIAKIKLNNGAWKDTLEISPPSWYLIEGGLGDPFTDEIKPDCWQTLSCSDKYLSITGMFAAGTPERLYITGNYAKSLSIGGFDIYSGGYEDVRGFMAKYEPVTGDWDWVNNGCGISYTKCYQIHDVVDNGVWHFYTSGCYHDQKFVAKYDFDGNEIWMKKFGSRCDYTEITLDENGGIYVTGTYGVTGSSESGGVINLGSIQLNHSKDAQSTYQWQGHYVAHIDLYGDWIWADDSEHVNYGGGHRTYDGYIPHGRNYDATAIDYKRIKPTGIVVGDDLTVYVGGWINGNSQFKNQQLVGISSYVAAISEPLQAPEDPVILFDPEDNSIPSISMFSSILVAVGAASIWKPKKREDEK